MAESNTSYVQMEGGESIHVSGLDNTLSQEEIDHGLAVALQQQENAAAYDASKKRHDQKVASGRMRTGRSCVGAIPPPSRQQQNQDKIQMVEKIVKTDAELHKATQARNARS